MQTDQTREREEKEELERMMSRKRLAYEGTKQIAWRGRRPHKMQEEKE